MPDCTPITDIVVFKVLHFLSSDLARTIVAWLRSDVVAARVVQEANATAESRVAKQKEKVVGLRIDVELMNDLRVVKVVSQGKLLGTLGCLADCLAKWRRNL